MANMSDAKGTFELKGAWNDRQIKTWLYIIFTQAYTVYSINLMEDSFNEALESLKDNRSLEFVGFGRWAFTENLQNLFHWSTIDLERWKKFYSHEKLTEVPLSEYTLSYQKYLKDVKKLWEEMYDNNLTVEWDFRDLETGVNFLVHNTGVHKGIRVLNEYFLEFEATIQQTWSVNFKNQCEHFEQDYEGLDELILELMHLYPVPYEKQEELKNLICSSPDWFGIPAWPYFGNRSDVPRRLAKEVLKRVRGEIPW